MSDKQDDEQNGKQVNNPENVYTTGQNIDGQNIDGQTQSTEVANTSSDETLYILLDSSIYKIVKTGADTCVTKVKTFEGNDKTILTNSVNSVLIESFKKYLLNNGENIINDLKNSTLENTLEKFKEKLSNESRGGKRRTNKKRNQKRRNRKNKTLKQL